MIHFLDCLLSKGHQYTGQVNRTRTNVECQRWDADDPWTNIYADPVLYPDDVTSLSEIENYCRNPDINDPTIWCYKMENGRYDYCDAPKCTGMCYKIMTFTV